MKMIARSKKILATTALLLALGVVSYELIHRQEAKSDSRKPNVWVQGRGYAQVLTLYDTGRYTLRAVCDVCSDDQSSGKWKAINGGIDLRDESSGSQVSLLEVTYKGCKGLVSASEKENYQNLPLAKIYFREEDTCPDTL